MQFAVERASLWLTSLKEKLIKIGAKIVTTVTMSRSRWRSFSKEVMYLAATSYPALPARYGMIPAMSAHVCIEK
jgi:hypothetical protein